MSEPTLPLAGRVALITGASRGIGRAIALRLAQAGATTVLAARTEAALATVAETIRVLGGEALVVPADVTDEQQLEALVNAALAQFGHIDILVNNAGGGPPRTPVVKARVRDWEWTVRLNLWAPMILTKLVLPAMIERRSGTIVHICSLAGLTGKPGEAAYAAAKFGVRGFSQSLFEEVREYGIKVSTIYPGYVDTALIPPNRRVDRSKMLSPEDVAHAVYEVAISSPRSCPLEITLQPQRDPFRT
ncbi:MAG TPA: SDR family oxidoreductase [Candidatus Binatia bacterium]|jgi:NAD(P)-dependent dehydrogenase (short-subunit alcohol dehydrogenase family)|nr:SDR family oxidoreductase [Candidatus Binatia bacterium]